MTSRMNLAWIITSNGWIQVEVSLFNLGTALFSLARGWGSGGKTDVNLKAVNIDQRIASMIYANQTLCVHVRIWKSCFNKEKKHSFSKKPILREQLHKSTYNTITYIIFD